MTPTTYTMAALAYICLFMVGVAIIDRHRDRNRRTA